MMDANKVTTLKAKLKRLNDAYKLMALEERQTRGKHALALNMIGESVGYVLADLEKLGVNAEELEMEGLLE